MTILTRRNLLIFLATGLGSTLLGSGSKGQKKNQRIRYVDGLCLLGEEKEQLDMPNCGFRAVILDVSSYEMVHLPDGRTAFIRTYSACQKGLTESIKAISKNFQSAFIALKGSDVPADFNDHRTACFLQFQGCDWVEKDLSRIASMHAQGLRIAQFTHHYANSLAGGCMDLPQTGLTPFGLEALREMERLKIIPDLAHASNQSGLDIIKAATRPVIVSHGACRSIVNNARCTSDAVIKAVAQKGGVMGIFMMSFWLTNDPVPKVDHLIAQIRHVINIGGIDAVGISNDYPCGGETSLRELGNDNSEGIKNYLPWWEGMRARGVEGFDITPRHVVIPELNSPRRMFVIHTALEHANFKSSEIEKIMGENWIRVLTDSFG